MNYGDAVLPERYWKRVFPEPNTGCWLWSGALQSKGYGQFYLAEFGTLGAHSIMCLMAHGAAPEDKPLAIHSCDVRSCVNPDHVRWGSAAENTADMVNRGRARSRFSDVTHCVNGHEFTVANTYLHRRGRTCRTCARTRAIRYYYTNKTNRTNT